MGRAGVSKDRSDNLLSEGRVCALADLLMEPVRYEPSADLDDCGCPVAQISLGVVSGKKPLFSTAGQILISLSVSLLAPL